ncbi:uncharacterized protein L201_005934 [Kwoniella dendrophila CBS 6074]|uniref:F-box domain-containing protein n=1 Tax=Kwoniella dendrophila CBS 6074 TaxID=1295534 RepID=A0AAX4K2K9_9TREE
MSARRVYDTPELMENILGFLDKSQLVRVLTLEKSFFIPAVGVLWKDVTYEVAQQLMESHTYNAQVYRQSIRNIILVDPELPKDEETQMTTISYLTQIFPNLLQAERRSPERRGKRKYDWKVKRKDDGQYDVDIISPLALSDRNLPTYGRTKNKKKRNNELSRIETDSCVGNSNDIDILDLETEPSPGSELDDLYPGLKNGRILEITYESSRNDDRRREGQPVPLVLFGIFGFDDRDVGLKDKIVKYLIDPKRREQKILSLNVPELCLELVDLEKICSFPFKENNKIMKIRNCDDNFENNDNTGNHHHGAVDDDINDSVFMTIKEIECRNFKSFDVIEFERFCEKCCLGGDEIDFESDLEVLILDHKGSCDLRLNDISRVVQNIINHLPNLYYLEIPFTIIGQNGRFIPVNQITIIESLNMSSINNKMRNLEKVILNIFGNSYNDGIDQRYPFPIEDVAQNLAYLNAPESCTYHLRNKSNTFIGINMSNRLNEEVHKYQRLAPDGNISLHANDTPPIYSINE